MQSPTPHNKQSPKSINRGLHIWGTFLSLAISAPISFGIGFNYYYKFNEGIPRLVFSLLMLLLWLGSSVIVSILISTWINLILNKTIRRQVQDNSHPKSSTHTVPKGIEDYKYNPSDTTRISKVFVNANKDNQHYLDSHYCTTVDESNPHKLKFQTTGSAQPVSHNSEYKNAEYIRKRLLEKETRILKVIDINVDKNSNHSYDFSAKIFVRVESLTSAAEIVDSANTILESEFNMKDTNLIPIISKLPLSPVM